jgi:hypothetical protein
MFALEFVEYTHKLSFDQYCMVAMAVQDYLHPSHSFSNLAHTPFRPPSRRSPHPSEPIALLHQAPAPALILTAVAQPVPHTSSTTIHAAPPGPAHSSLGVYPGNSRSSVRATETTLSPNTTNADGTYADVRLPL